LCEQVGHQISSEPFINDKEDKAAGHGRLPAEWPGSVTAVTASRFRALAYRADLERRMRVLERADRGPIFVTFNH
jgi:hypothetical protein